MPNVTVHQITTQSVSKETGESYFNVSEDYGRVMVWSHVDYRPTILTTYKGYVQLIQFDTQRDMIDYCKSHQEGNDIMIILNDSDKVSVVDLQQPFKFLKELT